MPPRRKLESKVPSRDNALGKAAAGAGSAAPTAPRVQRADQLRGLIPGPTAVAPGSAPQAPPVPTNQEAVAAAAPAPQAAPISVPAPAAAPAPAAPAPAPAPAAPATSVPAANAVPTVDNSVEAQPSAPMQTATPVAYAGQAVHGTEVALTFDQRALALREEAELARHQTLTGAVIQPDLPPLPPLLSAPVEDSTEKATESTVQLPEYLDKWAGREASRRKMSHAELLFAGIEELFQELPDLVRSVRPTAGARQSMFGQRSKRSSGEKNVTFSFYATSAQYARLDQIVALVGARSRSELARAVFRGLRDSKPSSEQQAG